jgi:hypothetical protein
MGILRGISRRCFFAWVPDLGYFLGYVHTSKLYMGRIFWVILISYIWVIYGLYMGYIWDVYGLYMGGLCMGCIWIIYGFYYMGCIWVIYGL